MYINSNYALRRKKKISFFFYNLKILTIIQNIFNVNLLNFNDSTCFCCMHRAITMTALMFNIIIIVIVINAKKMRCLSDGKMVKRREKSALLNNKIE